MKVFAKKAIRRENGKIFEAIGNVAIIHKNDTLYGQVARFNSETGLLEVDGNVRLVNKDLTLYGSSIKYFTKTKNLEVTNARLSTALYKIVARSLKKVSEQKYIGTDAEYTTCKDCPESWTIYGDEVRVDFGNYIEVDKAVLRIRGVDFAYFPYFIFPIKTKRQSGFILPNFRGGTADGLAVFQPFFWAINQEMDMTLTPAYWSNRGVGADVEYRYAYNTDSMFHVETRGLFDRQTKESNNQRERYHFKTEIYQQFSRKLHFHARFMELSDLDFISDHPDFSREKINQSEYGIDGHLEYRASPYVLGSRFLKHKSLLRNDSFGYSGFDDYSDNSVNISPGAYLSLSPIKFIKSKHNYFNLFHAGAQLAVDRFYQSNFDPSLIAGTDLLRNADRVNFRPYLGISVFDNGVFSLRTQYDFDLQYYNFRLDDEEDLYKFSGVLTNEFSFEFQKIFGKAKLEKQEINTSRANKGEHDEVIGSLEKYNDVFGQGYSIKRNNSYKHLQKFIFSHYFIPVEKESGNSRFLDQIQQKNGWFDFYDSIRSEEYFLGDEETRKQIPLTNTLEFRWEHDFIRKSVRSNVIKDDPDYNYHKVAHLHFSQGYSFKNHIQPKTEPTRLAISGKYRFSRKLSVVLDHYYFYDSKENISDFSIHNDFRRFKVYNKFSINDFSTRANHKIGSDLLIFDSIVLKMEEERDLLQKKVIDRTYGVLFLPQNKCWFISTTYSRNEKRQAWSFDFKVNLGQEDFDENLKRVF